MPDVQNPAPQPPAPLTPEEQAAVRACESEIRTSLEKNGCDIQGVARMTTGNIVIDCVIVKVRQQAPSGAAAVAGAPNATPPAPAQ